VYSHEDQYKKQLLSWGDNKVINQHKYWASQIKLVTEYHWWEFDVKKNGIPYYLNRWPLVQTKPTKCLWFGEKEHCLWQLETMTWQEINNVRTNLLPIWINILHFIYFKIRISKLTICHFFVVLCLTFAFPLQVLEPQRLAIFILFHPSLTIRATLHLLIALYFSAISCVEPQRRGPVLHQFFSFIVIKHWQWSTKNVDLSTIECKTKKKKTIYLTRPTALNIPNNYVLEHSYLCDLKLHYWIHLSHKIL